MALARGHSGLSAVVAGPSRLQQDAFTSQFVARTTCLPNHGSPSQFCVSFSKGLSRTASVSKQRLVMPRASAAAAAPASAATAQSMTRIADTFVALKQQGKVQFTSKF